MDVRAAQRPAARTPRGGCRRRAGVESWDRTMWFAHALTLSRIPIALALWATYGDPGRSLALVVIAALTDAADGNVARFLKRRGHTRPDARPSRSGGAVAEDRARSMGDWLDPLVDKIFVAIVLALVWVRAGEPLVVVLVGARELLFVPLAAIYAARRPDVGRLHADPIGKAATIAQFAALAAVLAAPAWALPAAIAAAGLGLAAVAHYAARLLRAPR
jgi:phosphatidylglycerophosphate synthase